MKIRVYGKSGVRDLDVEEGTTQINETRVGDRLVDVAVKTVGTPIAVRTGDVEDGRHVFRAVDRGGELSVLDEFSTRYKAELQTISKSRSRWAGEQIVIAAGRIIREMRKERE